MPQHGVELELSCYVGSYAPADQPGLYAFTFDGRTGALTPRGAWAGVTNPSYLVVGPGGSRLYTVSETTVAEDARPGAVVAWQAAGAPPALTEINRRPSGGDAPCFLAFDPAGRRLIVTNYVSGSVTVLSIGDDGALGAPTGFMQHGGHGLDPGRQDGPHAHSATFTPDGRLVIVADLGADALFVYTYDAAAGRLRDPREVRTRPGAGPRHAAFHPDGSTLYVANELENTVTIYDYDGAAATLRPRQALSTLPPDAPPNTVADIHVAPDGARVYVSNRGHDSIAVFTVDSERRLALLATPPCGGAGPRHFTIAPGGDFLVVANKESGDLAVLPVLADSPGLGAPVARVPVPGASCVQFVPAG